MGKSPDKTTKPAVLPCTHCGEACPDKSLSSGESFFCCVGCQTVYDILKANGLGDFYRMDDQAGKSQRKSGNQDYSWLDVEKLANRMIRYRDETQHHVAIELPAIHCASCVWLLERLPQLLPGVRNCIVDITRKQATIQFDPQKTSLRQVAETLARIGYPPHFQYDKSPEEKSNNKGLIYRIGVAGFAFGNIMLLSFPEYFGLGADAGAQMVGGAMGYILLVLSIPVMFYAGNGFFTTAWHGLRAKRANIDLPIAIGMIALFSRSVYEIFSGTGPGYLDSLSGLVFFLLIGRWFQSYTFARLNFDRDYRDYFPVAAHRLMADGSTEPVASEDLRPGDHILVRPGQLIPADGLLVATTKAGIDYSFVTGEAIPRFVAINQEVFAGGRATSSPLEITVTKETSHSYLLQLWQRGASKEEEIAIQPPEALVRYFTLFVLALAAVTLAWWYPTDTNLAFRAATAVLIIACPCALALAAPFAYGTLQRLFGQQGYYLRGAGVIRELGRVNAFVFDKTGTLVDNENEEAAIYHTDVHTAAGYAPVFLAMAERSDHPRSRAMARALRSTGVQPIPLHGMTEEIGKGLVVHHHGQVFRLGKASFCGLPPSAAGTYAVAGDSSIFSLKPARPHLRPGGMEFLTELSEKGSTSLISGDQKPETTFWEQLFQPERTYFGMSPFAKQEYVEDLQKTGREVLMVGDGLNDAGALTKANVGLAVSDDEARFSPACDGILTGDELHLLPRVIRASTNLRWVLWLTFGIAFCYNIVGLSYAVSGTLSPIIAAILMPLSSITVVVIATLGAWVVYGHSFRSQDR